MASLKILSLLLLLIIQSTVECSRILCIFMIPSKSHSVVFHSYTKELARRGHEVVVVSPYPLSEPIANYTDINVMPSIKPGVDEILKTDMYSYAKFPSIMTPIFFWNNTLTVLELMFTNEELLDLLHDSRGFDLVIVEDIAIESLNSFAEYFRAPLIVMSALRGFHWGNYGIGNPLELAYVPNTMLPFKDKMTFLERFENTLMTVIWDIGNFLYQLPRQEALRKRVFGENTTSLYEVKVRPSLVLVNNHFSLNYPRPLVPAMVEIGGMHVARSNKKLPNDIQKFLDDATEGAIYFSMGTNLRSDLLPENKLKSLLSAFAEIPQRVLWKWESEYMPGQPKNVKLAKWLPQQDILAHRNVKAFITHGGLMSMQESIFHGVPLLGIPIYGDQMLNVKRAVLGGYGVLLDLNNITKHSSLWALDKILHNTRIRDEVKRHSTMFRDQPETPLQRAIYWTEYVLRYDGAPQMRSAALDLAWYQRNLLDVLTTMFIILQIFALASFFVLRRFIKSHFFPVKNMVDIVKKIQ